MDYIVEEKKKYIFTYIYRKLRIPAVSCLLFPAGPWIPICSKFLVVPLSSPMETAVTGWLHIRPRDAQGR